MLGVNYFSVYRLGCRHEFFRDGFANQQASEIFNPKPLAVWIALEKDGLARLCNRDVKAAEV